MKVHHSAFQIAQAELELALDDWQPGHMIFLVGPSGVGKTTLRRQVMRKLLGAPQYWGRGLVPSIEVFATLPHNAYFSSRELAADLVEQLRCPSLDWISDEPAAADSWLASMAADIDSARHAWKSLGRRNASEGDLWRCAGELMRARQCRYVCLDQATALLYNHRNLEPAQHVTQLMTLAEKAGVMFVMTGVPGVTKLWEIHYELRRRVSVVWMPPYNVRTDWDREQFLRLLITMEKIETLENAFLLVTMSEELLAATGGIFAEVLQLLKRARVMCRKRGGEGLCRADILSAVYPERDLATLWNDVRRFEQARAAADLSPCDPAKRRASKSPASDG